MEPSSIEDPKIYLYIYVKNCQKELPNNWAAMFILDTRC